eukprot:8503531-Pyramimonas_sp.AAC.1
MATPSILGAKVLVERLAWRVRGLGGIRVAPQRADPQWAHVHGNSCTGGNTSQEGEVPMESA